MKKLLLILPFVMLFSCSVQKRKYQNGYYVDWHTKSTHKETKDRLADRSKINNKQEKKEVTVLATMPEENLSASANESNPVLNFPKKPAFRSAENDSCDILVFKDGSEIRVHILDISLTEVKYKKCDSPDGPNYINRKSELFMIKYADGKREVLRTESPEPMKTPVKKTYKPTNSYKRQNHPLAVASLFLGIAALAIGYILLYLLLLEFVLTVGFYILPLLAAIAAIATATTALKRIKEEPEVYKGKGMAKPGLIFGIVVVGIYLFLAFLVLLFLGF